MFHTDWKAMGKLFQVESMGQVRQKQTVRIGSVNEDTGEPQSLSGVSIYGCKRRRSLAARAVAWVVLYSDRRGSSEPFPTTHAPSHNAPEFKPMSAQLCIDIAYK